MRGTLCSLMLVLLAGCSGAGGPKGPSVADAQADFAVRQAEANRLALQAEAAANAGRTDDAIGLYREAINTWNRTPGAYNNLGLLLIKKGDARAAADAFTIEAELNPQDARPLKNLGQLYFERSWPEDAMKFFEQALERDPDYLEALRGAVLAADTLRRADAKVLDYVKRALFQETDATWSAYLQRQRFRIEQNIER
jgi:tetratricopeptide (TPR) repeat protein